MARVNFDDSLRLPSKRRRTDAVRDGAEPPGPNARGPIPKGEKMLWVYAWIIQNGPRGRAAAAYGESPHDRDPFTGRWDIKTEMAHDSDSFTPDKPALATAMALMEYEDRSKAVDWWSEAILIKKAAS